MKSRDAYQEQLEAQLRLWDKKIDEWKARAEIVGSDAKIELHKQIDILHLKTAAARQMLQALKESKDDAWSQMKGIAERSWEDLKKSFDDAESRFK